MPATLPHGSALPLNVPPIDPRNQRRQIPPELAIFDRDETSIGKAFKRLAREIFRPDIALTEREEQFKRQLAEAVNQTAEAAFTPRTTISYLSADQLVDSDVFAALSGMAQSIVVPLPARIHTILNVVVHVDKEHDEFLELMVAGGAVDMCFSRVRMPAFGVRAFQWNITAQDLLDAEPETLYTLEPQARVTATGPIYNFIAGDNFTASTFTVRVEPRSLVEE